MIFLCTFTSKTKALIVCLFTENAKDSEVGQTCNPLATIPPTTSPPITATTATTTATTTPTTTTPTTTSATQGNKPMLANGTTEDQLKGKQLWHTIVQQNITTPSGIITSPSLPYPRSTDYVWVITLQDTFKAINLTFHGTFDIQPCSASYLEVRDGDSRNSMLVGKYCGSVPPPTLSSSTNSLYLYFRSSENQTTSVAFNATFKAVGE